MTPMPLIVAERLTLVRDGLVGLLDGWPHGPVQGVGSLDDAAAALSRSGAAVLLLDLDLLGPAGPHALQALRERCPAAKVVALATRETREEILGCLAAGAHGYVAKTAPATELLHAIAVVEQGGVHVPAALTAPGPRPGPARPDRPEPAAVRALTGRQRDVLRLLAEGRSTKDIARTLDLAVSTIKVHLAAVYRTFGARNRVEALCRAGCLPTVLP